MSELLTIKECGDIFKKASNDIKNGLSSIPKARFYKETGLFYFGCVHFIVSSALNKKRKKPAIKK